MARKQSYYYLAITITIITTLYLFKQIENYASLIEETEKIERIVQSLEKVVNNYAVRNYSTID